MTILLDTSFYIALIDPTDKYYRRAPEILKEIQSGIHGQPFTNTLVMAESAVLVAIRTRKNTEAMQGMKDLFVGENCIAQLLRPTESTEIKAWELFIKINTTKKGQLVSYTDSINIIIAQQHHINEIVTFDEYYEAWIRVIH
nr:PIN domain-containing protein [Candidatus Sigynarchaeota archaeon]